MTRMIVLMMLVLSVVTCAAEERVSVLLNGHDEPIVGWLRQVSDSQYFLQSDSENGSVTYNIPGSEILSVDGKKEIPASAQGSGRLLEFGTYEIIQANGDVEYWSRTTVTNTQSPRTHVTFGAQDRELATYREMEAFDQYGNRLEHYITPRDAGIYDVIIELAVPAGFQETIVLNLKTIRHAAANIDDNGLWTYTRNSDFPEDRIFTRKVQLPEGAEFVSATHFASPWSDVLPLTIYWRRYCPKETDDIMTVTYRLPH